MDARGTWRGVRLSAVAASAAGISLFNRGAGTRYFARSLASMPGVPSKLAQLLSILGGQDASVGAAPIQRLALSEVKTLLLERMPRLFESIESIDPEGRSASLGQVHRARLGDGRDVAVKIRLPGVEREIQEQLALLAKLGSAGPAGRGGMDLEAHRLCLSEKFSEELDYRVEARRQSEIRADWQGDPLIVIPFVHAEFLSSTVLVQSYEESLAPEEAVESASPSERRGIADALTRFLLGSVLRTGRVHADLHSGNWGWRRSTGQLVVYDFGSVLELGPGEREALRSLLAGTVSRDDRLLWTGFEGLGFSMDRLAPIRSRLPELCAALLSPFLSRGEWIASDWSLSSHLDAILGPEKWTFRAAGAPWFLLLMRAVAGWSRAVSLLDVPVEPGRLLEEVIGSPVSPAPATAGRALLSSRPSDGAAARLFVSVVNKGAVEEEVVRLELPARAIEEIEELLPPEGRRRMAWLGVELSAIRERARDSGMKPQALVEAEDREKRYRVWLA